MTPIKCQKIIKQNYIVSQNHDMYISYLNKLYIMIRSGAPFVDLNQLSEW